MATVGDLDITQQIKQTKTYICNYYNIYHFCIYIYIHVYHFYRNAKYTRMKADIYEMVV